MKKYPVHLLVFALLLFGAYTVKAQTIYYVGNNGAWDNWDIYSFDITTGIETRLTTDPAIDNHPGVAHFNPGRICFSSNRDDGEFDLYVANVADVDGSAVRLTYNNDYPDRHPHWHPVDSLIIYTSKDREVTFTKTVASECSQPIIIKGTRRYEGLNLIDLDNPGTVIPLDIGAAWDGSPGIWVSGESIYVGHPSFNPDGDMIVFTAAIDNEGKNWEVYTVGFNTATLSLVSNSLSRVTFGPDLGANPIKMSGGAVFSHDGTEIILNSTRTTGGNSQIFVVPADAENLELTDAYRRTWHRGNDYVPEPINDHDIVITSDLGFPVICPVDTFPGATPDLDVVLLEDFSTRSTLGEETAQQTLLIADEVSWFCGLKPNLSACTFMPRIMCVEAIWLESFPSELLPEDLLAGYGSAYADNAWELYDEAQANMWNLLFEENPTQANMIQNEMTMLWNSFPGYADDILLQEWLDATESIRKKKYVVPALMDTIGLGNGGLLPPCDNELTISGAIGSSIYTADQTITSDGTIAVPDDVIFRFGDCTWLTPGFNIQLGATFATIPGGCPPDNVPPVITCSPDIIISNDPGSCGGYLTVPAPLVSDDCLINGDGCITIVNSWNSTDDASGVYLVGTTIIEWTATDQAGNTSTCIQAITVLDQEPPVISCPADVFADNNPGLCESILILPPPIGSDSCPIDTTITPSMFTNSWNGTDDASDTYPTGVHIIEWTAIDDAGNTSTCTQIITVEDLEAPLLQCQNIDIYLDVSGVASITNNDVIVGLADNCDPAPAVSIPQSIFDTSNVGSNFFTATAVDDSGNAGFCSYIVTVFECVPLHLILQFDNFPNETRWDIKDNIANILAQGGPYTGQPGNSLLEIDLCVPAGCSHSFTIYDSFSDGICCQYGAGYYQLTETNSGTILAEGAAFGAQESTFFCLPAFF